MGQGLENFKENHKTPAAIAPLLKNPNYRMPQSHADLGHIWKKFGYLIHQIIIKRQLRCAVGSSPQQELWHIQSINPSQIAHRMLQFTFQREARKFHHCQQF